MTDIKLPPRPEPDGFITDGPFDKPVVINVYRDSTLEAYARKAVRMNASQAASADQVQALREALEALPEPGEWYYAGCNTVHDENHDEVAHPVDMRNDCAIAKFIAASSPKVIRALLAERDALARENEAMKRCAIRYLEWLGVTHIPLDQALYDDMHNPSMCGDAAIDAALAQKQENKA